MARVQKIIDQDQKSVIDFQNGQREKNPDGTDKYVSLSPVESVPPASLQETAAVPCPDKPASTDKSILIVEDEGIFAEDLKETLHSLGYKVDRIEITGAGAVRYVETARPDLILMDINLGPGMNGIDAAEKILSHASIPIIYLTAYADPSLIERAKTTSPYGYILKPFDARELRTAIEIAFYKHKNDLQLKKAYGELEQRIAERTTELNRINRVLLESEKRYRAVVEDQTELICRFTPDGTLTFVNEAYCRYFMLDKKDCIGRRHMVLLPPDDTRQMNTHIASLTRKNPVALIRHRIIMPSGEVKWQRWSDRAIFDKSGTVVEYQSVGRDITNVVQAEEALRESEDRFRTMIDWTYNWEYWIAPNRGVVYCSPSIHRITGYSVEEFIADNGLIDRIIHPDDRALWEEHIPLHEYGEESENPAEVEFRIITKDGTTHWIGHTCRAIFADDGTWAGRRISQRDITDRKRAEKAHLESEEHYRQLVEVSPDAIFILNDYKIMEINSAALTLFGASSPRQIIGESVSSQVHPDSLNSFKKWIQQVMDGKKPVPTLEQKIVQLNGTILDIEAAAVLITYKCRQAVQVIARDITQRKTLEEQLKNQQELLEKQVQERTIDLLRANEQLKMEITERKAMQEELTIASDEKDLLLREIHHRVKNNLQLIIGLVDMTKMRTHDTAIAAVLTDIMAKIHTMGLIHTRLYESKRFDKINMKQQVTELVDTTSGFYIHEYCTIDFSIDCAEIYLPVDQAMPCALALNEILSNIHKHAFKGRRSGVVKISSSRKKTKLRFVIRDDGVGLPKGFDIEQSNRLGLKLMRALVEQQLHGSVLIKSENGTQVVIEIPLAQAERDHGKSTCS